MAANIIQLPASRLGTATKREHPVKRRLRERGQTITWLAAQLGLSTRSIQRTLKGQQRMNNSDYRKMLRILEMTENDYWNVGPRRSI